MLAMKLREMEEEEDGEEVVAEVEGDEEEGAEEMEDVEADDDSEESEEEAGEGAEEEEEEIEVKDMELEDLKTLIRDILQQEMGQETGEEDGMEDLEDFEDNPMGGTEVDAVGGNDMVASDDEIDLNELLAELEAEEEIEEGKKEEEVAKEELKEALKTIRILKKELNEVNLFNAKLLYLNKVFKATNLTESQKVSVIQAFDKAESVKEVKLVYETLSEGITPKKPVTGRLTEQKRRSFASAPTGKSTARPEVITEVSDAVKRMQKLAGIIK